MNQNDHIMRKSTPENVHQEFSMHRLFTTLWSLIILHNRNVPGLQMGEQQAKHSDTIGFD